MSASSPQAQAVNIPALFGEQAKGIETYIMFRIAQRVLELTPELTEKGLAPIKMSIGAPLHAPPQVALDYFNSVMDEPGIHAYSVPKGEPYFREAVAKRMKTRFGVDIDANKEVTALIGSKEGLANMFRALITPRPEGAADQDVILIPDPGYASYRDAIRMAGGRGVAMALTPENQFMPDIEAEIQKAINSEIAPEHIKAVVVNYPQNPTGMSATLEYYHDVVTACRKHNVLLIGDAAYADVFFPGETPPPSVLEVPGAKDIAIEFHTLSKPYAMTGWRVGFAVGNADAVGVLARIKGTMDTGIWRAVQKTAAFALGSEKCDDYITRLNGVFKDRLQLMLDELAKLGWPTGDASPIPVPTATFYLWLPIPRSYAQKGPGGSEAFASDVLEKAGVVLVPGTAFGQSGEGWFRMSVVNEPDELREVARRLKDFGFTYQKGS